VYFCEASTLLLHQLRTVPFHKSIDRARTVCFCFGHTVEEIVKEFSRDGISTLQTTVRDACRRGETDCETRNPQGHCCLGNLAKVIAELKTPKS
jgi:hypothetical protein